MASARSAGRTIGLVPTMGALHEGHASLVRAARAAGDFVCVSIFVNPTQFGPSEDFARYPRPLAEDLRLCEGLGVDLVFAPDVSEIYQDRALTSIHVDRLGSGLCGPHRPGHFDGVCIVVAKFFHIVAPDRAYFGEKDAQQLAIIRRMARDLDLAVQVVGCPIVRESDGLALSSRNRYLSAADRQQATSLHAALQQGRRLVQDGQRDARAIVGAMRSAIEAAGPCRIDYVSIVEPEELQPVERIDGPVLMALAVWIGTTRLIDNLAVDPAQSGE